MERGGGGAEVTPHSAVPIKEEDEIEHKDSKLDEEPVSLKKLTRFINVKIIYNI